MLLASLSESAEDAALEAVAEWQCSTSRQRRIVTDNAPKLARMLRAAAEAEKEYRAAKEDEMTG